MALTIRHDGWSTCGQWRLTPLALLCPPSLGAPSPVPPPIREACSFSRPQPPRHPRPAPGPAPAPSPGPKHHGHSPTGKLPPSAQFSKTDIVLHAPGPHLWLCLPQPAPSWPPSSSRPGVTSGSAGTVSSSPVSPLSHLSLLPAHRLSLHVTCLSSQLTGISLTHLPLFTSSSPSRSPIQPACHQHPH